MDSRDRIEKARRVELLLKNEEWTDAMVKVRQSYIDEWADSEPHEHEKREELYRMLKAHEQIAGHLEQALDSGKVDLAIEAKKKRKFSLTFERS